MIYETDTCFMFVEYITYFLVRAYELIFLQFIIQSKSLRAYELNLFTIHKSERAYELKFCLIYKYKLACELNFCLIHNSKLACELKIC